MTVTVLVSSFPPFGSLYLSAERDTSIHDILNSLAVKYPTLPIDHSLRLTPTSRPLVSQESTLAELCEGNDSLISFRLTPQLLGGKGGFGSQLRAAGGRMSSQKTSNNDSCRDLSGRRLSTVKEAKKLAAYLESEPERKKAALEAQKQKLEALERQLERSGAGANESEPSAIGKKRRLDDTEFLEESQNLVDNVKSAVVQGLLKKRKKVKKDETSGPNVTTKSETQTLKTAPKGNGPVTREVAVA